MTRENRAFMPHRVSHFYQLERLGQCLLVLAIAYADTERADQKGALLLAPCSRAAAYVNSQLRNHVDLALGKSERQPWEKVVRRALSAHVLNLFDCVSIYGAEPI